MCFFFSLMPATICVTVGYFVLFAASKADGLGLSNLAFCDCSFYPPRWRLRYAGWSLSHGGHSKDTTFGKAMNSTQPAASIVALSLFFLTVSAPALAHASLTHASPSAGSTMSAAPHEVMLTFTDSLEAAFSKVAVTDASGVEVSQGKAQVSANTMRIGLKPLNAGVYNVNWRAISTDTHKTEGSFTFQIIQ
jgi:copper resistance protein C